MKDFHQEGEREIVLVDDPMRRISLLIQSRRAVLCDQRKGTTVEGETYHARWLDLRPATLVALRSALDEAIAALGVER